jgi:glycosyltransferase involved in cell wall biosynthesis
MKFLIAVPIFNEERYARAVLAEIASYGHDVLVINDGSTDRTPKILAELELAGQIRVLTHPENRGYGQSLIDAFSFAACRGYDWVLTMDCDEQHEPAKIPMFYAQAIKDEADIISGSRYLQAEAGEDMPPPDRRNINKVITDLLNDSLKLHLTDAFCGYKAHRVSAMRKLHLTIPGYAFPMQFWVQAVAEQLRIVEIPVRRIYKDATRHFGGMLDDPTARLEHYLEVFKTEQEVVRDTASDVGREQTISSGQTQVRDAALAKPEWAGCCCDQ